MWSLGLRKVYPYYFTFTTFTKGRWVGERILDVFAREFRAHPAEEYERCIQAGTLTVNYEKVPTDYKLKHNDLLANIVHRYLRHADVQNRAGLLILLLLHPHASKPLIAHTPTAMLKYYYIITRVRAI